MQRKRNRRKNAFTLVEILIVVVILGILAAIVVPQFTSAADEARESNIASQVSSVQSQIELFRQREGSYPTLAQLQAAPTDGTLGGTFGVLVDNEYLRSSPRHPNPGALNADAVTDFAGDGPWRYDESTGRFGAIGL